MPAKRFSRIPDFIGSRLLSFILVGVLVSYYILLLVFSVKVHLETVINISQGLPFKILYGALFANLMVCTVRRTPAYIRRCRKAAVIQEDADRTYIVDAGALDGDTAAARMAEFFKKKRFAVVPGGEEPARDESATQGWRVSAVRRRFSPLGSLVSHWGMVITLLGVVVSLNTHFIGEALLPEGAKFWGTAADYTSYDPPTGFRQHAPKVSFRVGKVEAEFWDGKLLFTRLEADLTSPADGKGEPFPVRINEPLFSSLYTTSVRLTGYGFAPFYVLRNPEGKELESSHVNLAIFPPGNEDSFRVQMIPHRFYVQLYPDYRQREGKPGTASMNLKNPVFHLKVASNKVVTFDGLLLPYQRADVEGYSLAFEGMKRWITVRVTRDAGYPVIFAGCCLICFGTAWRFAFPRKDVAVRPADDGRSLLVTGRADSTLLSSRWMDDMAKGLESAVKGGNVDAA